MALCHEAMRDVIWPTEREGFDEKAGSNEQTRYDGTAPSRYPEAICSLEFVTAEGWLLCGGYGDVVGQELSQ